MLIRRNNSRRIEDSFSLSQVVEFYQHKIGQSCKPIIANAAQKQLGRLSEIRKAYEVKLACLKSKRKTLLNWISINLEVQKLKSLIASVSKEIVDWINAISARYLHLPIAPN